MKNDRIDKIKKEAKRRVDEWLKNSTFDEMSVYGSLMRFDMSIGLRGYPFEKPKWMNGKKFCKFVTEEEFKSTQYDEIIEELFKYASQKTPTTK